LRIVGSGLSLVKPLVKLRDCLIESVEQRIRVVFLSGAIYWAAVG
jgi:hypothetical protein